MTIEDTKNKMWLSTNKVCFVTNSIALPSSLLITSLKTYIEYIPIQNFWLIPGIKDNKPFYGLNAFVQMLEYMLSNTHFDYVIYIDEDCFINDFPTLIDEFKLFVKSKSCIGGLQDGGALCHRNHSKLMINTFLSFWNIKLLRDKKISIQHIIDYINSHIKQGQEHLFSNFLNDLKTNNVNLYNFLFKNANKLLDDIKQYRLSHFNKDGETPYANIVKNDQNNKIEQFQEPYTFDDETAEENFEPYYILEQALVYLTNSPIYYLFGTDLYEDETTIPDNLKHFNGLTSAIYHSKKINNDYKLICVHTWFSRAYTKWPSMQLQLDHTKRINTIIKKYSRI